MMRTMRILLLCLAFLPAVVVRAGAQVREIDAAKLPAQAETTRAFVPEGWTIEAEIEGDLNKDAIPDQAVILVEAMPADADKENPPERQRALLLLFKTDAGALRRAALAGKALLCTRCGGAFFGVAETPVKVTIEKGVVIVRQEYGSRELTEETLRFRYDAAEGRFVFIGMDRLVHDRLTGLATIESSNYLTGVKVVMKERPSGKGTSAAGKRTQIFAKKRYIEEVEAASN